MSMETNHAGSTLHWTPEAETQIIMEIRQSANAFLFDSDKEEHGKSDLYQIGIIHELLYSTFTSVGDSTKASYLWRSLVSEHAPQTSQTAKYTIIKSATPSSLPANTSPPSSSDGHSTGTKSADHRQEEDSKSQDTNLHPKVCSRLSGMILDVFANLDSFYAAQHNTTRVKYVHDTVKGALTFGLVHEKAIMTRLSVESSAAILGYEASSLGTISRQAYSKAYFIQNKFNLLREEGEGYSKLINLAWDTNLQLGLEQRITTLIGTFHLDPNRVLDIMIHALGYQLDVLMEETKFHPSLSQYEGTVAPFIDYFNSKPKDQVYSVLHFYIQETSNTQSQAGLPDTTHAPSASSASTNAATTSTSTTSNPASSISSTTASSSATTTGSGAPTIITTSSTSLSSASQSQGSSNILTMASKYMSIGPSSIHLSRALAALLNHGILELEPIIALIDVATPPLEIISDIQKLAEYEPKLSLLSAILEIPSTNPAYHWLFLRERLSAQQQLQYDYFNSLLDLVPFRNARCAHALACRIYDFMKPRIDFLSPHALLCPHNYLIPDLSTILDMLDVVFPYLRLIGELTSSLAQLGPLVCRVLQCILNTLQSQNANSQSSPQQTQSTSYVNMQSNLIPSLQKASDVSKSRLAEFWYILEDLLGHVLLPSYTLLGGNCDSIWSLMHPLPYACRYRAYHAWRNAISQKPFQLSTPIHFTSPTTQSDKKEEIQSDNQMEGVQVSSDATTKEAPTGTETDASQYDAASSKNTPAESQSLKISLFPLGSSALSHAEQKAREMMKRMTQDTAKTIGKTLCRSCNPCPLALQVLLTYLSYPNFVQPLAESVRYLNDLSLDVLVYLCLQDICSSTDHQKTTNISTFIASVYKSYFDMMDLVPLLDNIEKHLLNSSLTGATLFNCLLSKMGCVDIVEETSSSQLRMLNSFGALPKLAMQGALARKETSRSSIFPLRDHLWNSSSWLPLYILTLQLENTILYHYESMPMNKHINLSKKDLHIQTASYTDSVHQLSLQLADFCTYIFRKYASFMTPNTFMDIQQISEEYQVPLKSLIHLFRPVLRFFYSDVANLVAPSDNQPLVSSSSSQLASSTGSNEMAKMDVDPPSKTISELKLFSEDLAPTMNGKGRTFLLYRLEEELNSRLVSESEKPDPFADDPTFRLNLESISNYSLLSPEFLSIFWSLRLADVECEVAIYKEAMNKVAKEQAQNTPNADQLEEISPASIEKDMSAHMHHVLTVFERLQNSCSSTQWMIDPESLGLTSNSVSSSKLLSIALLQHCILPRALHSPEDALFCGRFIAVLHSLNPPFWSTQVFLDTFFDSIPLVFASTTQFEAARLGRMVCCIMELVTSWRNFDAWISQSIQLEKSMTFTVNSSSASITGDDESLGVFEPGEIDPQDSSTAKASGSNSRIGSAPESPHPDQISSSPYENVDGQSSESYKDELREEDQTPTACADIQHSLADSQHRESHENYCMKSLEWEYNLLQKILSVLKRPKDRWGYRIILGFLKELGGVFPSSRRFCQILMKELKENQDMKDTKTLNSSYRNLLEARMKHLMPHEKFAAMYPRFSFPPDPYEAHLSVNSSSKSIEPTSAEEPTKPAPTESASPSTATESSRNNPSSSTPNTSSSSSQTSQNRTDTRSSYGARHHHADRFYRERDGRDNRDNRDTRDSRDNRDNRDGRDNRDSRDNRDNRDNRESREGRDFRDTRDSRDFRDSRDHNRDRYRSSDNRSHTSNSTSSSTSRDPPAREGVRDFREDESRKRKRDPSPTPPPVAEKKIKTSETTSVSKVVAPSGTNSKDEVIGPPLPPQTRSNSSRGHGRRDYH